MNTREMPNSKSQHPNKLQPPIPKGGNGERKAARSWRLGLGSHWNLFGSWDLVFGISRRPKAAWGFTLVELLVSVGLTAILLWGLLQLFTSATKFSSAVSTESELCASGRALLARMTREVAGIAPLTTGYIRIFNKGDGFDSIQFVGAASGLGSQLPANAPDDGSLLAHIKYGPLPLQGADGPRQIGRGVKLPTDANSALKQTDLSDEGLSANVPIVLNVLGVRVEQFSISYIHSDGTTPLPEDKKYVSGDNLPRAILIKIRLRDPRSQATITLQSAAYLAGSGL